MIGAAWNLTAEKLLGDLGETSLTVGSNGERKQTGLAEEKWVLRNIVTIFSVSVMKLEDLQDRNLELLFQM